MTYNDIVRFREYQACREAGDHLDLAEISFYEVPFFHFIATRK